MFETASDSPQMDERMISITKNAHIKVDSTPQMASKIYPTEYPKIRGVYFGVEITSPDQTRNGDSFIKRLTLDLEYCQPDWSNAT